MKQTSARRLWKASSNSGKAMKTLMKCIQKQTSVHTTVPRISSSSMGLFGRLVGRSEPLHSEVCMETLHVEVGPRDFCTVLQSFLVQINTFYQHVSPWIRCIPILTPSHENYQSDYLATPSHYWYRNLGFPSSQTTQYNEDQRNISLVF